MVSEAPPFWWGRADWRAAALYPFSAIYGAVAARRLRTARREPIDVPIVCVGNFTVGGAGKTPIAIALGRAARAGGLKPGFLSRGYGGSAREARFVDPEHDGARTVGDEPLLLAEHGPVVVTPDRAAGARLLAGRACDVVIMDDGFQSARVHIDYALLVVDGTRGIGNGHTIPGGPLRAPLHSQMRYADGLVKMGGGSNADALVRMAARGGKRVFEASYRVRDAERFGGRRFLAFAGIGDPAKFFSTIEAAGGIVAASRTFPDHHVFTPEDVADLATSAHRESLQLITTTKDMVRLATGSEAEKVFARQVEVLEIDAAFDLGAAPMQIVRAAIDAWQKRRSRR